MARQTRRLRWPNQVEESRLEAIQNAAQSSKQAARARDLVLRTINQRMHQNNPEATELLLTKVALLLAEIEADQERIQKILIEAANGVDKED